MSVTRKKYQFDTDYFPELSGGEKSAFTKFFAKLRKNVLYAIGRQLAKTKLGVFITAHSYVHDSYEWYRLLIYHSGRSIENIQELMHEDDKQNRSEWLFARSNASEMHLDDDELDEILGYWDEEPPAS